MENYIVINGNKVELTPEQLKALGLERETNPFEKNAHEVFHYINERGTVATDRDANTAFDSQLHGVANYCTDKEMMEQRALHETLNRLIWRYSMEHKGNEIDWNNDLQKYHIYYNHNAKSFDYGIRHHNHIMGAVYFHTKEIAIAAIKEIIEPFMAEHPDFKL